MMNEARDRALEAVSLADSHEDAQAMWRLAKAHNMLAREIGAGAAGDTGPLLAHRLELGSSVGGEW